MTVIQNLMYQVVFQRQFRKNAGTLRIPVPCEHLDVYLRRWRRG